MVGAAKHGGSSTNVTTITLGTAEVLTGLEGMATDGAISQLTLVTSKGGGAPVRYGPFGKPGKTTFSIEGSILGFFGRAGPNLISIGAYYV